MMVKTVMTEKMQKKEKCILVVLMGLSLLAAIIKLFVGFDIDEGYAVSMPYRLLQGDALFLDMWEVHQTSSFLPAMFLLVYEKITGGMESVVVYLRIVATLIHGAVSFLVWKELSRKTDFKWSMLLALLYFNLLPKWIISLDFSMQQVWGITGILLLLQRELETGKDIYDFWMGIILAASVLAYPGMVLCYPVLLLMIVILNKDSKIKTRFNKCALLTLGCAVMAVLFLGYVLSAMSPEDFIESIPMVFMDGTHQFTMETKLMLYVTQWLNVGKQLVILSAPAILIAAVILFINKCRDRGGTANKNGNRKKEQFFSYYLLSFVTVTSVLVIIANLFGIQMGPFHFQVRYLMFFICTFIWCVYGMRKQKKQESNSCRPLFWGPFFLTAVSFLAILIFSNVGPDSSSSYLSVGIIAGWILWDLITKEAENAPETTRENEKEKERQKEQNRSSDRGWNRNRTGWLVLALFVLSLIFCKGYYVRITEYGPSTILQERKQITEGPLKGIYVLPEDYVRVTEDYKIIQEVTEGVESFLYLGTEGISNLYAKCLFVSPSTISTPAFNEQWVSYFEMYPEKEPAVIALAKNTIDDRDKFFAQNPFGIWITEKYDILHMEETDSLCIIRKK